MARIVIDLDGVITSIRKKEETYKDVFALKQVKEKMDKLKEQGHHIIINTARHMLSTNHNVGLINKKVGKTTLDWLEENKIPYDEIIFGKPYGQVYIDDNAWHFQGWDKVNPQDFNTNKINIVIPMAGLGSRFQKAGYKEPKPLIKIFDKYMFEWAVESFNDILKSKYETQLIFIILKEHNEQYNLSIEIKNRYKEANIIIIDKVTRGQAETVLKAKKYINNLNKLIIFNADTFSECPELITTIEELNCDGIIPCFTSTNPKYSFVKSDHHNNVIETKEKIAISNQASNGLYYFGKGRDFIFVAEDQIEQENFEGEEFYVIPIYNKLIQLGKKIKKVNIKSNWILGTPEELDYFQTKYKIKDS